MHASGGEESAKNDGACQVRSSDVPALENQVLATAESAASARTSADAKENFMIVVLEGFADQKKRNGVRSRK